MKTGTGPFSSVNILWEYSVQPRAVNLLIWFWYPWLHLYVILIEFNLLPALLKVQTFHFNNRKLLSGKISIIKVELLPLSIFSLVTDVGLNLVKMVAEVTAPVWNDARIACHYQFCQNFNLNTIMTMLHRNIK